MKLWQAQQVLCLHQPDSPLHIKLPDGNVVPVDCIEEHRPFGVLAPLFISESPSSKSPSPDECPSLEMELETLTRRWSGYTTDKGYRIDIVVMDGDDNLSLWRPNKAAALRAAIAVAKTLKEY